MDKLKVGDTILVEQAWEDELGQYHDEYAKIRAINKEGKMKLNFEDVSQEVREFLQGAEFDSKDYLKF